MKQKLIATLFSTALVIAPLPAFTADTTPAATPAKPQAQAPGPLAPGKAAGVKQAQDGLDDEDLLIGGGVVIAVVAGLCAVGVICGDDESSSPSPTPSPATTTTTP